tara:strand:+ start:38 stop:535 length:498 start_codon:yes stop_codon:yes gene_type:complete
MTDKKSRGKTKPTLKLVSKPDTILTPKQRHFCDLVVKGKIGSYKECYATAYDVTLTKTGGIPKWTEVEASKLMANPKIALSIQTALEKRDRSTLSSAVRLRHHVMTQLYKESLEASSDSSRIRSLELIGKTIGLFTDQIEVKGNKSVEDIDEEIRTKVMALISNE